MKHRIVKFRAWLPTLDDNEEEVYEMFYDLAFEEYEPVNELLNGVDNLMQYTGLDDVNGNEIYEGDFIQFLNINKSKESIVYKVVWYETMWCLYPYEDGPGYIPTLQTHIEGELSDGQTILIVGNVHQTPDLQRLL